MNFKKDLDKKEMERAAVECLLKCEGYQHYSIITIEQEKPDVLVGSKNDEQLGIEVSHPFCENEALAVFKPHINGVKDSLEFQFYNYPSSEEIVAKIQTEIDKKIKKVAKYSQDYPISLLIQVPAAQNFQGITPNNFIIPSNAFKEILLLHRKSEADLNDWVLIKLQERNSL